MSADIHIPGSKKPYTIQPGDTWASIANSFDITIKALTEANPGVDTKNLKPCIPPANVHAMRHTYATRLLEANEHPRTVQELLGHADVTLTLNIYSHVSPDLKKRAAAKLEGIATGNKILSQAE